MASVSESDQYPEQDSEDDFEWEEVQMPEHQNEEMQQKHEEHLEITIPTVGSRSKKAATASKSVLNIVFLLERCISYAINQV